MDAELVAWRERVGGCGDLQLMAELVKLVRVDRRCEARMLMCLGEVDERRLFLAQGHSSLFSYATAVLRMSEAQTYLRIQAARLARQFPVILDMLVLGELNLSTLKLLDPHLTAANHAQLLERARAKSKREVELLIAELAPRPDVSTRLRKLPASKTLAQSKVALTPSPRPETSTNQPQVPVARELESCSAQAEVSEPVRVTFVLEAPRSCLRVLRQGRYELEMTVDQQVHDMLRQLQDLLQHQVPGGDLRVIVTRAIREFHERTLRQRFAQLSKPRSARVATVSPSEPVNEPDVAKPEVTTEPCNKERSRYIPRAVKREVYARDGGRCTFVSAGGHRCNERGTLEFHHVHAFALGGATTSENIKLVCRAHNGFFATQDFGAAHMQSKRTRGHQAVLF